MWNWDFLKDIHYSMRDICVDCIQKYTGEEKGDIQDKMDVISPNRDEISNQKIYPVPIGNDPERKACINEEMDGVDTRQVLETECKLKQVIFIQFSFT